MKEERSENNRRQRSWIERISKKFSGEPQDREALVQWLRDAQKRGLFDSEAQGMIEGVLQVGDLQVRDIMIPRSQMTVIRRDDEPEQLLAQIVESGHSRFPVVGENRDDIVGVLLAKDMLRFCNEKSRRQFDLRDILRPAVFIPESKRLNVLLKDFRARRNHLAIVVDEYSGVAGMVTIEDVLEQIVGDIEDEHDIDEGTYIRKFSDTNYTVKALTPIEDFNDYFNTTFSDEEFDTIGGLVTRTIGHMPKRGENLSIDGMDFNILSAGHRRVHLLRVTLSVRLENEQKMSAN
ncbi:MAG: transporter associated domain-containing protein [Gammaproteobacteria bacterium]